MALNQQVYGNVPVLPVKNQELMLKSTDTKLENNKKIVFDFWRVVLLGLHLDQVSKFMDPHYIQHNPNVETGMEGFLKFFKTLGGPKEIPKNIPGLVSIVAEGDYVTLSLVSEEKDKNGKAYTTTWFDMFRLENGKIVEHWDCDKKRI